jgi:hypothetical protein
MQIIIDGVDVVQRIAELAGKNIEVKAYPEYKGAGDICTKIEKDYKDHANLHIIVGGVGQIEGGTSVYSIRIMPTSFIVSLDTDIISEVGGPEFSDPGNFGVFIPIGKLK